MPLSSQNQNSPSDKSTLINILLTLYKFVKFGSRFFPGSYNYNYDYIPSLAMTTSPSLPLINFNIPSQELPNIKWVTLVIQQITILNANKARPFENGIPSFSVGYSTEENLGVAHQIEVLKSTEPEIEAADSKEDLKNIAWKIAFAAKQITQ